MAFSKQKAKPSFSHMEKTSDEIESIATADETVTNMGMTDVRRMEVNTDDSWTDEAADSMKTGETGEDVAAELGRDIMKKTIRGPCNTGVPFSCVRCGHLSFLALCREPEIIWAIRCFHCCLIQPILPAYA